MTSCMPCSLMYISSRLVARQYDTNTILPAHSILWKYLQFTIRSGSRLNCQSKRTYFNQVKGKAELDRVLDEYNVGDTVSLKIQRGSENLELPINLEEKSS
ncbi:hypothetical protein SAY87_027541 [Trapa incisa]|uniref:Uncharacterized protein n=1 Tax=Trapa incisa TaxID=236973 RepID=A0AAN7PI53_9MYRT|nr:hypothetical protein SAY87_027541 [Trapa incisa]